jgi:hypothetical protein
LEWVPWNLQVAADGDAGAPVVVTDDECEDIELNLNKAMIWMILFLTMKMMIYIELMECC